MPLSVKDLIIDPEFSAYFDDDPHEDWQLEGLAQLIREHGWQDSIKHWHGLVMAGHTRLAIYEDILKTDPDFPEPVIEELYFPSREAALKWLIGEQLYRRNMSSQNLKYHRGKLLEELDSSTEQEADGRPEGYRKTPPKNRPQKKQAGAPQQVAKKSGVHVSTVYRDKQLKDSVDSLVDRGVADKAEITKVSARKIMAAAKAPTNSEAKRILEEGVIPLKKPQSEHAKKFGKLLKLALELNRDYPYMNFDNLRNEIDVWARVTDPG